MTSPADPETARPQFGASFIERFAGTIVRDPHIAIVELVANSWDAGARKVEIQWPSEGKGETIIADDGVGMSEETFRHRWMTLSYDRVAEQGIYVESWSKSKSKRRAFGRHGIGRLAPFCFSTAYIVESRTHTEDAPIAYRVTKSDGDSPFTLLRLPDPDITPGTTIRFAADHCELSVDDVRSLLGTRFVASPQFAIVVNQEPVELTDLTQFQSEIEVSTDAHRYSVLRIEYARASRTAELHGVAFWTNGRLVGNPGWEVGGAVLLDARTNVAKRTTYVVQADSLDNAVKPDWSGYHTNGEVIALEKAVTSAVKADLHALMGDERRRKKVSALRSSKEQISRLPVLTQERIAIFAEKVQQEAPSLSASDLDHVVQVLATLEASNSGFTLLHKLAELEPTDYDTLDRLLDEWTVRDLARVADELHYRLEMIARLEQFLTRAVVDEVHELLPLFERSLWMFGPEFEAVDFMSNRGLTTILREMFDTEGTSDARRPDIIAPIQAFSCDAFDNEHEASGLSSVIVLELKRIPHTIAHTDKDQAMTYAREVRKAASVGPATTIVCWVLGDNVASDANEPTKEGPIEVRPMAYAQLLRRAHARTFNLLSRVETKLQPQRDADLAAVLEEGTELELFHDELS